jgi:hypothetical protein
MAKTLGDMISRIKDDFVNESITTAQVRNAINAAISNYSDEPFWFNQKTATLQTVAGQEYYGVSSFADLDIMTEIMSMTAGSVVRKLSGVGFAAIDQMQTGTVTGQPFYYSLYASQIRFYPIPGEAETVTVHYTVQYADLTENDASNPWVDKAEELIRQAAKYRLALDILQADDLAGRCKVLAKEAYDGLLSENRRRRPQTRLYVDALPIRTESFNINRGW